MPIMAAPIPLIELVVECKCPWLWCPVKVSALIELQNVNMHLIAPLSLQLHILNRTTVECKFS